MSVKVFSVLLMLVICTGFLAGCGEGNSVEDTEENRCSALVNPNAGDQDGDGIINQCDTDNDNDTIDDELDNCPLLANTDQLDTNGDGLGDACDADGDGIESTEDNCPATFNPEQLDGNDDAIGDACDEDSDGIRSIDDNCPATANIDQLDSNDDGIGDACDVDNDGILNNIDNCPDIANPEQLNSDEAYPGDACQDTDEDLLLDVNDNCPFEANPDQADTNGDGVGNACDVDSDSIPTELDNCPFTANFNQADSNDDGLGDACDRDSDGVSDRTDNCPVDVNPEQEDEDENGQGDACDTGLASPAVNFFEPVNLSDNPGLTLRPAIKFDNSGYYHAVWDDNTGIEGATEVYYTAVKIDGFEQQEVIKLSNSQSEIIGLAQRADIDVAPDGSVHVVWQDTKTNTSDIYYLILERNTETGLFEISSTRNANDINPETNLSNSAQASNEPTIAIDAAGIIYVVWSSDSAVNIIRSTDNGASFSSPLRYRTNVIVEPAITVSDGGLVRIVWAQQDSLIYVTSTDSGETYETPRQLFVSQDTIQRPDIQAYDENVYIVWDQELLNQNTDILMIKSGDGGETFSDPLNLSANSGTSIYPSLAVGPTGDVFLAWSDTTTGNYETVYVESDDGGETFSELVVISPSDNGSLVIDSDVDENNNFIVGWDDNRYESFDIALSYGTSSIPLVNDISDVPSFFDPEQELPVMLAAAFSDSLISNVTIYTSTGASVVTASNIGTSAYYFWDGRNADGEVVSEGEYSYVITAYTPERIPIERSGTIRVYGVDSPERLPQILTFATDRQAFSPNDDGRTDIAIATATFNQSLPWEVTLLDADDNLIFSQTGVSASTTIEWDGLFDDGNSYPEGTYTFNVYIQSDDGSTAQSAVDIVIDMTPVEVEDLQIVDVDLSAGTPGSIGFHITESAVVTIYIFDESGFTTVNELVRTQLGGGYDGEEGAQDVFYEWDGTSGNGTLQEPGTYLLRIWCRDFGANPASEYPFIREIQIRE